MKEEDAKKLSFQYYSIARSTSVGYQSSNSGNISSNYNNPTTRMYSPYLDASVAFFDRSSAYAFSWGHLYFLTTTEDKTGYRFKKNYSLYPTIGDVPITVVEREETAPATTPAGS